MKRTLVSRRTETGWVEVRSDEGEKLEESIKNATDPTQATDVRPRSRSGIGKAFKNTLSAIQRGYHLLHRPLLRLRFIESVQFSEGKCRLKDAV